MTLRLLLITCVLLLSQVTLSQNVQCPGAPESRLIVGEQAQVIAEGGSNLRVRPTADAILLNVVPRTTIVPVVDGPFCSQGYTWWQVDYASERGWLAEGVDEFYWLAPFTIQRAQIDTVRVEIQPTLVDGITIDRLPDPPRSQFLLEGYPAAASSPIMPAIVIYDEMPDKISIEDAVIAQQTSIADGQRFIIVQIDDTATANSDVSFTYRYRTSLEDGRFIEAYLPVSATDLPLPYDLPEDDADIYLDDYLEVTITELDQQSPQMFTPSLDDLDNLIRSLRYDAPAEISDVLTYQQNGIRFIYHPQLATTINENKVDPGHLPAHTELTLQDYPAGNGVIRIYRIEDIPGNDILSLQQIIQRQPSSPPRIPIPSQTEPPGTRTNLRYIAFQNGTGVRYLATFNDMMLYSFQGLCDDGQCLISALLAVDDTVSPELLDALISSLEISR